MPRRLLSNIKLFCFSLFIRSKTDFKIPDFFRGQGAIQFESGAYMGIREHFGLDYNAGSGKKRVVLKLVLIFGTEDCLHHITHVALIGYAVGGFLWKGDEGLKMSTEIAEKHYPRLGIKYVPPHN